MKASILIATYSKPECLPNTLYSISRQKTIYPFEVCIVDDISDVDPEPVVRKYLPGAKYKRLESHVGGQFSQSKCFDIMSPDVDMVVMQSCDVMCIDDEVFDRMFGVVGRGVFVMPEVRNTFIPPGFCNQWDKNHPSAVRVFEEAEGTNIYQGTKRPSGDWLIFLGAMMLEDARRIGLHNRCCDIAIQQRIKEVGLEPKFIDVRAIHQKHPSTARSSCSIVDSCEYWCARKAL